MEDFLSSSMVASGRRGGGGGLDVERREGRKLAAGSWGGGGEGEGELSGVEVGEDSSDSLLF